MTLQRLKLIEVEEDGDSVTTEFKSFSELKKYASNKSGDVVVAVPEPEEEEDDSKEESGEKATSKKSADNKDTKKKFFEIGSKSDDTEDKTSKDDES